MGELSLYFKDNLYAMTLLGQFFADSVIRPEIIHGHAVETYVSWMKARAGG